MLTIILFLSLFSMKSDAFPLGSCTNTNANGSPYDLVWTLIDQNAGLFCFQAVNNNAQSTCATNFRTQLTKVVIKSQPLCQSAFVQVNVDGIKKGGGVYFDVFGQNNSEAELRVTSMNYNNNSVSTVMFCIITKPPCNEITTFCGGETCTYSIYDPFTHECCPVNVFRATNSLIYKPPPPPKQTPPTPVERSPPTCGTPPSLALNCSCSCVPSIK